MSQATCDAAVQRVYGNNPMLSLEESAQELPQAMQALFIPSPWSTVSESGKRVVHVMKRELVLSSHCTHFVRPSLADVKEAEIVFEVAWEHLQLGDRSKYAALVDGIRVGLTSGEHEAAKGTRGAANTFMYHWGDREHLAHRRQSAGYVWRSSGSTAWSACRSASEGPANKFARCNIIILKYSCLADASDHSDARGTLTVFDIDEDGQRRRCGTGPLAEFKVDRELFFCCDTPLVEHKTGATIVSMEVDGVQLVHEVPESIYPSGADFFPEEDEPERTVDGAAAPAVAASPTFQGVPGSPLAFAASPTFQGFPGSPLAFGNSQ